MSICMKIVGCIAFFSVAITLPNIDARPAFTHVDMVVTPPSSVSIELGTLSLYFTTQPAVTVKKIRISAHEEQLVCTFPSLTPVFTSQVLQMINAVNNKKTCGYTVRVTVDMATHSSLVVTVVYNPEDMIVSYNHIDTIQMSRGFVIHIIDRALVHQLESRPRPTIAVV